MTKKYTVHFSFSLLHGGGKIKTRKDTPTFNVTFRQECPWGEKMLELSVLQLYKAYFFYVMFIKLLP